MSRSMLEMFDADFAAILDDETGPAEDVMLLPSGRSRVKVRPGNFACAASLTWQRRKSRPAAVCRSFPAVPCWPCGTRTFSVCSAVV